MTMTTGVLSVSVVVSDQDAALEFYTEVLGCELRTDVEVWPGARMVEVVPPGSGVSLVLLTPDSQIPVAIRLGTPDARGAHDRSARPGCPTTRTWSGWTGSQRCSPHDPDGNGLVYMEEPGQDESQ
jgi:catechol 2,3-dioxygenase-like lactoylglutathione lyase family enzyme